MRTIALVVAFVTACIDPPADDPFDDQRGDFATGPAGPIALSGIPRGVLNVVDAEWMAWLSARAYLEPPEFQARIAGVAPSARVSWFFAHSTQAYYVDLENAAVLVFRGSEAATADWRKNLDTTLVPAIAGKVHRGFENALASVWDFQPLSFGGDAFGETLRRFVEVRHGSRSTVIDGPARVDAKPLYITGHSLGGALATLAYVRAETDGCDRVDEVVDPAFCVVHHADAEGWWIPVHAVYTFGAPRIGDPTFGIVAGAPLRGNDRVVYRFVNRGDLVTEVPRLSDGFSHPQRDAERDFMIHITHDDALAIGGFGEATTPSIGDHDIEHYIRSLHQAKVLVPQ
jgi:triacylglycerol lipase